NRSGDGPDYDLVLLDWHMPEMDGLEVQRELNAMGVTLPVVMLTGHGDIAAAVQAMKDGAVEFLEKPSDKATLLQAIDNAFARLERSDQVATSEQDAQIRISALSAREREVLDGLAQGYPNKTIAYDLGISARTVEVHRANMMTKLGVVSFPEALRIAFAAGLGKSKSS
ncbi:MAG: response regulator transcription factor, partial [Afipia sp.]|nr:response regulator transcription factor [Afipia sp.]